MVEAITMIKGSQWTTLVFGFLALVGVLGSPPAFAQSGPGDYSRSIVFDGLTRTYDVHVPASYVAGSSVPLVLDFHGYTSNSSAQAAMSGFRAVSDAENFIVAYPQGFANSWNAFPSPCTASGCPLGAKDALIRSI